MAHTPIDISSMMWHKEYNCSILLVTIAVSAVVRNQWLPCQDTSHTPTYTHMHTHAHTCTDIYHCHPGYYESSGGWAQVSGLYRQSVLTSWTVSITVPSLLRLAHVVRVCFLSYIVWPTVRHPRFFFLTLKCFFLSHVF